MVVIEVKKIGGFSCALDAAFDHDDGVVLAGAWGAVHATGWSPSVSP